MIRPDVLKPLPSQLTSVFGAITAAILFAAMLHLAAPVGFAVVRLPDLLGGIFTADLQTAFWVGYVVFFSLGVLIIPPVLVQMWMLLPGDPIGASGAAVKGVTVGAILWAVNGLLLPLFQAISSLPAAASYGFFALGAGIGTALWFLVSHLAYGTAFSLIAAMTHGMKVFDMLGWESHRHGDVREAALGRPYPGGTGVYISTKPW